MTRISKSPLEFLSEHTNALYNASFCVDGLEFRIIESVKVSDNQIILNLANNIQGFNIRLESEE